MEHSVNNLDSPMAELVSSVRKRGPLSSWFTSPNLIPSGSCSETSEDDEQCCAATSTVSATFEPQSLFFRTIVPSDREEVQRLHEDWFPVTYSDEFYEDLAEGRMGQYGKPLYTRLAVEEESNEICGCVIGTFVDGDRMSDRMRELLLDNEYYQRAFYIMTLGTVQSKRKAGLGTQLVKMCMREVEADEECGALYLHVITFNEPAIRLYEKLGFDRVEEIEDYYCECCYAMAADEDARRASGF